MVVDLPAGSKPTAQPTNQDVLNALHDLNKKISQLSKNQQILETKIGALGSRLEHIESAVNSSYANIIKAANYGVAWQVCIYNLTQGFGDPDPTVQWK